MFAFYYGIMADLSPPVALAALAAAPIAKENPDKIGWEAMRIALAGYVIPFIFVYSPALMLQAGDPMAATLGFYGAVALATFKASGGDSVCSASSRSASCTRGWHSSNSPSPPSRHFACLAISRSAIPPVLSSRRRS